MATKYLIADAAEKKSSASVTQIFFQFFVLGLLVLLLVNYKGAAGLNQIRRTRTTGALHLANFANLKIGVDATNGTTIGRYSGWKVAASMGAAVWAIAVAGGLLLD